MANQNYSLKELKSRIITLYPLIHYHGEPACTRCQQYKPLPELRNKKSLVLHQTNNNHNYDIAIGLESGTVIQMLARYIRLKDIDRSDNHEEYIDSLEKRLAYLESLLKGTMTVKVAAQAIFEVDDGEKWVVIKASLPNDKNMNERLPVWFTLCIGEINVLMGKLVRQIMNDINSDKE